jgi:hypothetical protein
MVKGAKPDVEVSLMFEYLAWCHRCCFRDDFQKRFKESWLMEHPGDESTADYGAREVWRIYEKRGMVGCYQEYISSTDDSVKRAIVHAFNVG